MCMNEFSCAWRAFCRWIWNTHTQSIWHGMCACSCCAHFVIVWHNVMVLFGVVCMCISSCASYTWTCLLAVRAMFLVGSAVFDHYLVFAVIARCLYWVALKSCNEQLCVLWLANLMRGLCICVLCRVHGFIHQERETSSINTGIWFTPYAERSTQ